MFQLAIACLIFGHKGEIVPRKVERFIRQGEKSPQYRTELDVICKRCGKWQHPVLGIWMGF